MGEEDVVWICQFGNELIHLKWKPIEEGGRGKRCWQLEMELAATSFGIGRICLPASSQVKLKVPIYSGPIKIGKMVIFWDRIIIT
jgi:hypothetical protein